MQKNEKIVLATIAVGALILAVHYSKSIKITQQFSDPFAPIGDETSFGFNGVISSGHGTTISHEEKQKQKKQSFINSRIKKRLTLDNIF